MGEARHLAVRGVKVRLSIPLFLLAAAAVSLYYFGKWQAGQGIENRDVIRAAERSLAAGKAWRARRTKLLAIARAHADTARHLQITIPPVTLKMGPVELRGIVIDWQRVAAHWELADRADSTRADDAESRVADLELRLHDVLKVADCHILGAKFLPSCPSRPVSFAVGMGAGIILVLLAPKIHVP